MKENQDNQSCQGLKEMLRLRALPLTLFFLLAALYLAAYAEVSVALKVLFKALPILLLLFLALRYTEAAYQRLYLSLSLVFSLSGDAALALPGANQLIYGLGFFLCAHLSYIRLFLLQIKNKACSPPSQGIVRLLSATLLVLLFVLGSIIIPNTKELWLAVSIYLIVIAAMAWFSFRVSLILALGAVAFMFSDSLIAFSTFVYPGTDLHIAVMISYYLAQMIISFEIIRLGTFKYKGTIDG